MFTGCPFQKPTYSESTARHRAAEYRRRGWPEATAVRCPDGDGHWHAVCSHDDVVWRQAVLRRAELRAARERALAAQEERSLAMVEGMSHFGKA